MSGDGRERAPDGVSPEHYRAVLRTYPTGVTVITSQVAGRTHGMTANSVTSVSLAPPLILVCVDRKNDTYGIVATSGRYAVNVLAEDQDTLSRRFASKAGDDHRLEPVGYFEGPHGLPLLPGCVAHLECRVVASYEAGGHVIFLGHVLSAASTPDRRPLLYYQGGYHALPPR